MAYRDHDSSMWAQAMQAHGDYMLNALLHDARALRCINDPFRHKGKFVTPLVFSIQKELSLQRIERLLKEAHAHVDDRCMNLASEQGWHALVDLLLQHGGTHTQYTWRELFHQSSDEEAMEMCLRHPDLATTVSGFDYDVAQVRQMAVGRQEAARQGATALVHSLRLHGMPRDVARLVGEKVMEPGTRVSDAWGEGAALRVEVVGEFADEEKLGYLLFVVGILLFVFSAGVIVKAPASPRHGEVRGLNCSRVACPAPMESPGPPGPMGLCLSAAQDYVTVENTGILSITGLQTLTGFPSPDFNFSCPFAIFPPPEQPT